VIVTIDQDEPRTASAHVLLNEYVDSVHLDSNHSAMQFVERLGWAISDAEEPRAREERGMILLVLVPLWLLLLVAVSGLCRAARAGDETLAWSARSAATTLSSSPCGPP
jgi:hypothetical protein